MIARPKKSKFNLIDFSIILIIIFIIIGVFYRYDLAKNINFQANQDKFEIEFIIEDIQEASQKFLTAGTSFYITISSIKIGEIKEILDIRPAAIFVQTQDDDSADIVKSEKPIRIDVTGVLTCYGRKVDTGYMINGSIYCAAGKEFLIHTGPYETTITVLSMNIAAE
jgi:hypothetical protein